MQGRVKPLCASICSCSFLGASWVPCVWVRDCSRSDSIWLFIPWGLGFLCKCKGTFTALSLGSPSVWHLSIVTNGRASSDWSPGPMLVWVHLGLFCIVFICVCYIVCMHDARCMCRVGIVSGVFSLLLYVDRRKRFIIFILSQQCATTGRHSL